MTKKEYMLEFIKKQKKVILVMLKIIKKNTNEIIIKTEEFKRDGLIFSLETCFDDELVCLVDNEPWKIYDLTIIECKESFSGGYRKATGEKIEFQGENEVKVWKFPKRK